MQDDDLATHGDCDAIADKTAATTELRLLTINMHKGFGILNRGFVLHELRDAVRATGAEVVFLQEVVGMHRRHAARHPKWPNQPQYEFLADSMWPQFAYGRNAVYPDGDHGNALLSKYPIVSYSNVDISVGAHERRGLLHCMLSLPGTGKRVHAICVHLGLHESQRRQQVTQLLLHIESAIPAEAPVIVAGDFNDWRERIGSRMHEAGLRDVFEARGGRSAKTFPGRWPLLRLDRIYARGVSIDAASVLDMHPWPHLSDHIPLFAQVTA